MYEENVFRGQVLIDNKKTRCFKLYCENYTFNFLLKDLKYRAFWSLKFLEFGESNTFRMIIRKSSRYGY